MNSCKQGVSEYRTIHNKTFITVLCNKWLPIYSTTSIWRQHWDSTIFWHYGGVALWRGRWFRLVDMWADWHYIWYTLTVLTHSDINDKKSRTRINIIRLHSIVLYRALFEEKLLFINLQKSPNSSLTLLIFIARHLEWWSKANTAGALQRVNW